MDCLINIRGRLFPGNSESIPYVICCEQTNISTIIKAGTPGCFLDAVQLAQKRDLG